MIDGDAPDAENAVEPAHGGDLDPLLLEILVCPQTKKPLSYDREKQELVSAAAGLAYPIREGVPIMLIDEARQLSDEEVAAQKSSAKTAG